MLSAWGQITMRNRDVNDLSERAPRVRRRLTLFVASVESSRVRWRFREACEALWVPKLVFMIRPSPWARDLQRLHFLACYSSMLVSVKQCIMPHRSGILFAL